ncbi:MAG: Eco57I restriction-modification methylase domain-containing protein [Endomicrobiaceae bacterium]|nr:Eco57I restriction-modification methylase domain-containing protein [Endomicrobiaceae bacterium]
MADNINKELVKNTFDKQYNRGQFVNFIKELLNGVEERNTIHTNIPNQFKDYIKSYRRLGKYIYNDRFEKVTIDVIEVNLKRTSSLERARTMQRNFVARYLNGTFGAIQREAALVAFINEDEPQDWRFSLVKMDYKTEIQTDKRVIKVELTPAKRFSFLVGQNENTHTAQKQLFTCLEKSKKGEKITLEELTAAFNIEKVSQEFFDGYKELFNIFCKELEKIYKSDSKVKKDFDEHNIIIEDFAKKTLGQLVFLYFIQKKGWLGVEKDKNWNSGDKKFLRTLFNKQDYNNFFNDILEPLFYEALAKERDTNSYYEKFDCRIPFLNGGLFEPINNYSWTTTNLTIKNDLFRTIFDVFDLYNFTVKEDEPLEKEVAIDPEMLGKVFENLLPENIRKGNGAFYTPREIVHYMCQESLINYLDTQINRDSKVIEKEDLSVLVKRADSVYEKGTYGNSQKLPDSIKPNAKQIDKALENIKVCDPAIGSGAFPVGIMTEIVRTRIALNDYIKKPNRSSYELKRNTIENSIYGVDLDSGAVEIAKLRFYLSLVVDEEEPKNIRPLPNLDFKIMQGNSLISSYENIDFDKIFDTKSKNITQDVLFGEKPKTQSELFSNETDNVIKEIQQKLREYINIPYATKKSQIRAKIEDLMMQLIKNKLENDEVFKGILSNFKNEKSKGIEKNLKLVEEKISNLITNRENRKFFPWKLFFADVFEKGGFDIVIGNPPYIGHKGGLKEFFKFMKTTSLGKFNNERMDIFYYFFHLSLNILRQNGINVFITTNYYITADSAIKLRTDFKNRSNILKLINFNELKIFESALGQHNLITLLKKTTQHNEDCIIINSHKNGIANANILLSIMNQSDLETEYKSCPQQSLYESNKLYIRLNTNESEVSNILYDIQKKSDGILIEFCNISQGLVSGCDKVTNKHLKNTHTRFLLNSGVFVVSKNDVVSNNYEKDIIKPWFKNSDIFKYGTKQNSEQYILHLHTSININKYPNVKKHINKYMDIIKLRNYDSGELSKAKRLNKLWALSSSRKEFDFSMPKIVAPQRKHKNVFGYTENMWCASADVYFITGKHSDVDLKFILALLNSNLYFHWLYHKGKRKGNMLELYLTPLSEVPIKKADENIQNKFIVIVDKILDITKKNDYLENQDSRNKVKEYEQQIDVMVYKLYELSYEEVLIIDKNFQLSEKEYNNFEL